MLSLKTHWSNLQKTAGTQQKSILNHQQLVIFNQCISGKQLFQVTMVCDNGHRFIP